MMKTTLKTPKIPLIRNSMGNVVSLLSVAMALLLISGCGSQQLQVEPHDVSSTHRIYRAFPEFIAVVAKPGDTYASLAEIYLNDSSKDWLISEFNGSEDLRPGQKLIIPLKTFETGGISSKGYQTVPVLTYHKFSKTKKDSMIVMASDFESQMHFLKKMGYRVITLDQFFDFMNGKTQVPKKAVVITIDDGWRSVYDIAFPVLKKYGYPATLFVYTDLINGSPKTLDWHLIKEMAENGIDIQCHSKTHRNFNVRDAEESFEEYFHNLEKELTESAKVIRKHVGKDVKYLAYPYGDSNPLVIALLKKLGYQGAFTVQRQSNPFFVNNYKIGRSMIYGSFDDKAFEKNLGTFTDKALR